MYTSCHARSQCFVPVCTLAVHAIPIFQFRIKTQNGYLLPPDRSRWFNAWISLLTPKTSKESVLDDTSVWHRQTFQPPEIKKKLFCKFVLALSASKAKQTLFCKCFYCFSASKARKTLLCECVSCFLCFLTCLHDHPPPWQTSLRVGPQALQKA